MYRERAAWGVWHQYADLLPSQYATAIAAAGGVPVLLPAAGEPARWPGAARAVAARLDGLVVSGGADLDPESYGERPHPRTTQWRPDRDGWEFALLDAAEAARLPVLGVCRGMQVMAVHAGGRLEQHVPDRVGHDEHSPGGDGFGQITVAAVPGSRLAQLTGGSGIPGGDGGRLQVDCHHHQSVISHPGFVPAAHAADGTLEAVEAPGDRFCVAVQWHPEVASGGGLFTGLVAAAGQPGRY
jgi:putative glutamine amidotransferase